MMRERTIDKTLIVRMILPCLWRIMLLNVSPIMTIDISSMPRRMIGEAARKLMLAALLSPSINKSICMLWC